MKKHQKVNFSTFDFIAYKIVSAESMVLVSQLDACPLKLLGMLANNLIYSVHCLSLPIKND